MTAPSETLTFANPFVEKVVSEYFVGREEELSVFERNLKALRAGQPNHFYIAGLNGTGKTFYLHKLAEIAKSANYIGVVLGLDLGVPPHRQLSTVLRQIIVDFQKQTTLPGTPPSTELLDDWDLSAQSRLFRHPRQDSLITADLRQDFETLATHIKNGGRDGIVLCIDEGQRIEPPALSGIKNALGTLGSFLVVLSLRLRSDAQGAMQEGRQLLNERAQEAEGDIGASAFYTTGIPMGPFKTDDEIRRLIAVRLAANGIQFSDDVAMRLGEIGERLPRNIIRLAAHLYNKALAATITDVQTPLLDDCFQEQFSSQMKEAVDLCANLSADLTDLLKALCRLTSPTTPLDLAKHAYPGHTEGIQTLIADGAAHQLDRLCISSSLIQKTEESYKITNNIYRYALKIALKLT